MSEAEGEAGMMTHDDVVAVNNCGFWVKKVGRAPATILRIEVASIRDSLRIEVGDILLSIAGVCVSDLSNRAIQSRLAVLPVEVHQHQLKFITPEEYNNNELLRRRTQASSRSSLRRYGGAETIEHKCMKNVGFYASAQRNNGPTIVTAWNELACTDLNMSIGSVLWKINKKETSEFNKAEIDEVLSTLPRYRRSILEFLSRAEYDELMLSRSRQADNEREERRERGSHYAEIKQYWNYEHPCPHCGHLYLRSEGKSVRKQCCMEGKIFELDSYPKLQPLPPFLSELCVSKTAHITNASSFYNGALQLGKISYLCVQFNCLQFSD